MLACTFFGHRDTPQEIELILQTVLTDLIEQKQVSSFYVGTHGRFDAMVKSSLKKLKEKYPHIRYRVVLAYLPTDRDQDLSDTIYPEGLELTPAKYAIVKRNQWMLDQCDYVITYVNRPVGGAAKFDALARKKGKTVLNLKDLISGK